MKRILLVEDNEANRDMLSRRLTRKGFHVLLAIDGEEAVRVAKSEEPDLILMDVSLPKLDGYQATQEIRLDPSVSRTPIIALTAHAMASDRQDAMDAGCDDYDTKPVDLERLLGKIAALIGTTAI